MNEMSTTSQDRWRSHRRYLYLLAKFLLIGLILLLVARVLSLLSGLLLPLCLGLALAYLFDPLVDIFERRRVPRTVVIAVLAAILLMLLSLLSIMVIPAFAQQVARLGRMLPGFVESSYLRVVVLAHDYLGYSNAEVDGIFRGALLRMKDALPSIASQVGSSVSTAVNAFLIPLFFVYFLRDFDELKLKPLLLVPPRFRDYVKVRARDVDEVVGGWLRGQLQVAGILAVFYAIALSLLGIKLGFAVGIMAGLLNVIPYFGPAFGFVVSIVLALIEEGGVPILLGVAAVFLVAAIGEGYFLTPRLVGAKVGLSPLTVIVVVLMGGALFGFLGLFLAVPVTAMLSVFLPDVLSAYRASEFWRGSPEVGGHHQAVGDDHGAQDL